LLLKPIDSGCGNVFVALPFILPVRPVLCYRRACLKRDAKLRFCRPRCVQD